jgi:hypothetical protein
MCIDIEQILEVEFMYNLLEEDELVGKHVEINKQLNDKPNQGEELL